MHNDTLELVYGESAPVQRRVVEEEKKGPNRSTQEENKNAAYEARIRELERLLEERDNPTADCFIPQKVKWVIIKNRYYNKLRLIPGIKFKDIEYVDNDAMNFEHGIKGLGAKNKDIIRLYDTTFAELSETIQDLHEQIIANWRNDQQKTLIFVYYAGHGIM